jgi:ankyrin repeat protein
MALLEAGANANAVDVDGVSALMWASGSEAEDEKHKKGLMEKATKGQVEVVEALLRYGAKIDLRDKDGITALMYASYHGHSGAVEVLLNWGADADIRNNVKKTALHLARNAGLNETASAIIEGPTIMVSLLIRNRIPFSIRFFIIDITCR